MADNASEHPTTRAAADKERSRQLSRPVSAREATRAGAGRRAGSKGASVQGASGGGVSGGGVSGGGGGRGTRGATGRGRSDTRRKAQGARRRPATARGGRSRTALFTWTAVALVVVVVVVLVVVSSTSSKKSTRFSAQPVSPTVLSEITHVPTSVFNKVGRGLVSDMHMPSVLTGQPPLRFTGKPGMLALLGEFCPYCAAERWAIITSFSRFGTFSDLKTMQSSTTDIDPATQTFTFATAKYTSKYFTPKLREIFGQDKPTGAQTPLEKMTKQEAELSVKYDHAPTAPAGSGNSIPFMDYGNKVIFYEVSYTPAVLQGLSRTTIAASLKDPNSPITKLIIGSSNNISAAICAIDGAKPGSVCSSPGVQAAAKGLELHV